mmetsp:Transcript_16773/g.31782  ORF Transcript_16773/g.31782 Transcript_16773/m.31782 type:complete len:592 (+) Transcript_16773:45-1820(+)
MGQSASAIDASNPHPEEFTYAKKESKETVQTERLHGRRAPDRKSSRGTDSRDDTLSKRKDTAVSFRDVNNHRVIDKKSSTVSEVDSDTSYEMTDARGKEDILDYLTVVGRNSSNLPLTWRDDPQLVKIISTLTAKEYAQKADAFIPCDIRVIGASSAVFDRKSEVIIKNRMNIGEKVTDPGRTMGGAICNSLLKVLYDFENSDFLDGSSDGLDFGTNNNLFDDDDDGNASIGQDSVESLQFGSGLLSWSTLIRQMKDVMQDQGYDLVPILTTSRKLDLNEPVNLLPPNFNYKSNKKFCLLVGCNYIRSDGELQNSHNDVKIMKDYIVNVHGFPEDDDYMTVLIDDADHDKPTHNNIIQALKMIGIRSRPGDAVFIQFSGHGGRISDLSAETECYDEVFAPTDFRRKGLISEKTIIRSLIMNLAEDVTVTILLDSCDTGFVFDMPYSWETRNDNAETQARLSLNDNFSFVRFLKAVQQMYDSSMDIAKNEDDYFTMKKNSIVKAIGETLKDVAQEAEAEVKNITRKTTRIVNKMMEAAAEEFEQSVSQSHSDEPRSYHNRYDSTRSDSYDYSDYDDDSSVDSYEGKIRRNYS